MKDTGADGANKTCGAGLCCAEKAALPADVAAFLMARVLDLTERVKKLEGSTDCADFDVPFTWTTLAEPDEYKVAIFQVGYSARLEQKAWKCTLCDAELYSVDSLVAHVETADHIENANAAFDGFITKKAPWECSMCDGVYETRAGLIQHALSLPHETAVDTWVEYGHQSRMEPMLSKRS